MFENILKAEQIDFWTWPSMFLGMVAYLIFMKILVFCEKEKANGNEAPSEKLLWGSIILGAIVLFLSTKHIALWYFYQTALIAWLATLTVQKIIAMWFKFRA